MSYRLGIVVSHPIQYYAPWFRHLAQRFDLEVWYAHCQDARGQAAAGFGVEFTWDCPLLEGYAYRWLTNVARHPGLNTFNGCDTPEVAALVRAGGFDAMLVFGWNRKSALQTILACWRYGVPVLMRGDSQLLTERSWGKMALKYLPYRSFLPRLAAHLYVGSRNKAYLQYYGVPAERLFFAPHFVDNAYFARCAQAAQAAGIPSQMRAMLGIPAEAFIYVFVGKLMARKRPADFVQACLQVMCRPARVPVHALVVGDGPLRTELETLARPYAERFHFVGFRNQSQLAGFYTAANALVLPSDGTETWGLVVNEAAACGLPALVSDLVGCGPDLIVAGQTGYTYPVGNVAALADTMLVLQEQCQRQPERLRQALAARLACYSMETATAGLEGALQAVTTP